MEKSELLHTIVLVWVLFSQILYIYIYFTGWTNSGYTNLVLGQNIWRFFLGNCLTGCYLWTTANWCTCLLAGWRNYFCRSFQHWFLLGLSFHCFHLSWISLVSLCCWVFPSSVSFCFHALHYVTVLFDSKFQLLLVIDYSFGSCLGKGRAFLWVTSWK